MVRILFLDRDGTLNRSLNDRPPNAPAEVELLPNVDATLAAYAAEGWRLVIVTNQGGVAFGYLSEDEARAIHQAVLARLSVPVDASYLCPHHPLGDVPPYNVDCPRRKPHPGAVFEALARFDAHPQDCLLVGDMESDRQVAAAAGVPFRWAHDFFGWREETS
jgi:D-glycero-D-manno-heptose 1,7-bisphosphate phosphatase